MNISGFDLNLLPVFDALMRDRSVTRAAARAGLSQPAVSNALARMRAHFGDRLFVHSGRAMVPTPRALELAPEIQDVVTRLRTVFDQPEFRPETCARTFRLATTDEVDLALMPGIVRELGRVARDVSVRCTRLESLIKIPETELRSGALDGAIGLFSAPLAAESGRYAAELYRGRYRCLARAGHPALGSRPTLSIHEFCRLDHVVTFYAGEGPGLIDRALAAKGRSRRVRLSLPHFLALPFIVANSDLIATVPATVADTLTKRPDLRTFNCPVALPALTVSLVWHARTHEDAAHQWLRGVIMKVSRALGKRR